MKNQKCTLYLLGIRRVLPQNILWRVIAFLSLNQPYNISLNLIGKDFTDSSSLSLQLYNWFIHIKSEDIWYGVGLHLFNDPKKCNKSDLFAQKTLRMWVMPLCEMFFTRCQRNWHLFSWNRLTMCQNDCPCQKADLYCYLCWR